MALSREEAELVYKLCVENDGIFTEDIFGRHIAKFRHSIQHGLVSNSVDFLNFLKLLKGSRQYSFHQDADGKKYVRLRDKVSREQVARLQDVEYAVFCAIETAGNRGIWTADIKKLCEITVSGAGGELTCVGEPADAVVEGVAGAAWAGEAGDQRSPEESQVVHVVQRQASEGGTGRRLSGEVPGVVPHANHKLPQIIGKHQRGKRAWCGVELVQEVLEEDVLSIIQILMLEDKVYSAPTALGDTIYIVGYDGGVTVTLRVVGWRRQRELCAQGLRDAVLSV
ncbi:RNA polymerase rpc34 subunit containing protein [Babesia caballi]|uniref:RNA polymerase rpc34 subunit containing protein n=1 Tax=Babesia caballi TaxID=5871 RepID=A0AAV4LSQ8_BABCB|nr:RNA polymerase rpc34 subunit containing protein [Babesia caballi]